MRRFGRPDEIASAALFLTDPQNHFTTGISLDVAGSARLGMGS
jgi:NAD(P)-dependent dehydrogenase (short-subunit alcohol dehydrogenase family)